MFVLKTQKNVVVRKPKILAKKMFSLKHKKMFVRATSGDRFPASGPRRSRQCANLYVKWPPGAISRQVAQGGPAGVQIYTKSCFREPYPSKRPREVPSAFKSLRRALSFWCCYMAGRPMHIPLLPQPQDVKTLVVESSNARPSQVSACIQFTIQTCVTDLTRFGAPLNQRERSGGKGEEGSALF